MSAWHHYQQAAWLLDDAKECLRHAYSDDDPSGMLDAIRRQLKLIAKLIDQIDGGPSVASARRYQSRGEPTTVAEQEALIAENARFRGKQP